MGIDLDGTLSITALYNPNLKLPSWLFVFLVPIVILSPPNKKIVEEIRQFKDKGGEIIIITARPAWATKITKSWLQRHDIPFSELYCVGFGEETALRKIKVIKEKNIDQFFDSNQRLSKEIISGLS